MKTADTRYSFLSAQDFLAYEMLETGSNPDLSYLQEIVGTPPHPVDLMPNKIPKDPLKDFVRKNLIWNIGGESFLASSYYADSEGKGLSSIQALLNFYFEHPSPMYYISLSYSPNGNSQGENQEALLLILAQTRRSLNHGMLLTLPDGKIHNVKEIYAPLLVGNKLDYKHRIRISGELWHTSLPNISSIKITDKNSLRKI